MNQYHQKILDGAALGLLKARDMIDKDLSQVVALEQNAQASPWSRLLFEESLTRSQSSSEHACRVLHIGDEVVGYHIVSSVVDELHILNVVAASHLQGIGLGHRLMQDIMELAELRSLDKLFLEVRVSNTIAQNLYQKWQFQNIAMRKQYYRNSDPSQPKEDALVYLRKR